MTRTHTVVDLATGQQTEVPYTPQEEIDADAAKAAYDLAQAPIITAQQRAAAFLADKDLGDFRALIASATSPTDLKTKIAALTAQQKANLIVAFILDYVASGRG